MSREALAAAGAALVVLWTVLPFLRNDRWWVRAFEFPRVQLACASAAAALAYGWWTGVDAAHELVVLVVLAACVLLQAWRIAPYTPLHAPQVRSARAPRPEDTLSVLVANVWMPNDDAQGLLEQVREHDPDVVLTVESDARWGERLSELARERPHTLAHPLDNTYGMHLWSRLPLEEPRVRFLVDEGVPSIHTRVVLRSGRRVELRGLHPAPPSPTENATSAERDAELLLVAREVDVERTPTVVLGDLNDVAWSSTTRLFQRLSGLLDPRVGRGTFSTYPARLPLLRWPLDHVFVSPDFELVRLARLRSFGSDHFPILAVLHHAPRVADEHERPTPEDGDHARARERIQAGRDEGSDARG